MNKFLFIAGIAGFITAVSCHKSIQGPSGTTTLELPSSTAEYFTAGVQYQNPNINEKATLGRVLFYDGHLSLNNAISCASCHKQALGFADNVAFSTGYEGRLTGRNSQPIANLGGTDLMFQFDLINSTSGILFWDGRETNVKNLVARPITNHVEMGITDVSELPAKLSSLPFYPDLFKKAFGDEEITADRISQSIAAFLISIRSQNTRFDKYKLGDKTALNALELQGMSLFTQKYNCESCHRTITDMYSSSGFVDIGLDEVCTDPGNGAVNNIPENRGKFAVPGLRNIALSAPYMHDGRFKTLNDVLDHYSHGIQNSPNLSPLLRDESNKPMAMNISDQEKQAIIAFLNTMTDFTMITDPKFSNPFKTK